MAAEEGTLSVIIDKVSFLKQVPWLLKATSDDETPTPGYMYQEICDISLASGSYCQTLLDYFLDRLDKDSCQVKLKVLRILHYVVQNGHPDFRQGLRRRSRGLQEAAKYSGPPDPLHGNTQYTAVRTAAQSLSQLLFDVSLDDSKVPEQQASSVKSPSGMGSSFYGTKMQGFGNAPSKQNKTLGESIVSGLKDFADRVSDPVDPRWTAAQASTDPFKQGDYRPVLLPVAAIQYQQPEWEKPVRDRPSVTHSYQQAHSVTEHRPGVAGGGWEDDPADSHPQLQTKSSSTTLLQSASDKLSSNGRLSNDRHSNDRHSDDRHSDDRHSDDSLNSSSSTPITQAAEMAQRLEDVRVQDWREEEQLVTELVVDCERLIPPRDKVNAFLRRCGESNSEMVISFLNRYLQPNNEQQAFRALLLIDYLMKSDHVTIDHIIYTCAVQLVVLYKKARGPTKAKARKVIRQLQLLSGQIDVFSGMPAMPRFQMTPAATPTTDDTRTNLNTSSLLDNAEQLTTAPLDTNSNPERTTTTVGDNTTNGAGLTLPVEPLTSARLLTLPDGRSSDSSPEWSSLQIPFAGSIQNTISSTSVGGGCLSVSCSEITSCSSDIETQAAEDAATFEMRKDSSMSEDSLKDEDGVFDFLNE